MADNSEPDGLDNRVSEFDQNAPSKLCGDAELSTGPGSHDSVDSIAGSQSKRAKMDNDDDGAPSSSETSPVHKKGERSRSSGGEGRDSIVSFDTSAESTPKRSSGKPKSANSSSQASSGGQDLSMVDMKTSWDGSAASGGSAKGEATDGETGYKVAFKHRAGMLADPVKIAKEREKEERVRQARERLKEERRRKLVELKEQQRIAQENREKQLAMRRKKIEDLRRRDVERRSAVEERRRVKEEFEKARRESILQRSEERVARFEAWKAGGRKGGRGHILGFGSATPRDICQPFGRPRRSSSHSALQRRSPNGSEMDSVRPQRRALSACSAVRRHCFVYNNRIGLETIREGRRSFIGTTSTPSVSAAAQHHQRPSNVPGMGSSMNRTSPMTVSMPSPVKMRENKAPRKQRPASVASSMPSFVGGEPAKSPRSKSTDRTGRDRMKTRPTRKNDKTEKDKENMSEKAHKLNDMEEDENEKDADRDGARDISHRKEKKERVSLSFFDRLSTPKFSKRDPEHVSKETPPKKESPIIRSQKLSQLKAHSTTSLDTLRKRSTVREKPSASHTKEATHKHVLPKDTHRAQTSAGRSVSPGRKETEKPAARVPSPGRKGSDSPSTLASRVTPPPSASSTPTPGPAASTPAVSGAGTPSQSLVASIAEDGTTSRSSGGSAQDITAEEYKARLAEKRRQAREKAEKEAEEERRRQEEARLAEEERIRKEEEEDRRLEEEAELARKAEQERLEKAIEAEEKRKKEETEKLEQEKKIKGEADKKAREEAERLEKEKQERAKKEEEERLQRKKKLEMIMKRVKTDATSETPLKAESPTKSLSSSINLSQLDSSQNSPEEHEKPVATAESSDEDSQAPAVAEGSAVETYSADMTASFMQDMETSATGDMYLSTSVTDIPGKSSTYKEFTDSSTAVGQGQLVTLTPTATPSEREEMAPSPEPEAKSKFRSPLLQQLVENKGGNTPSGGPKFKSPLLQNLLGKTKVGARMGLSSSTSDLVSKDTVPSADESSSTKESHNHGKDEDKDEDTTVDESSETKQEPESFEHFSLTNGIGKDSIDGHFPTSSLKSFESSLFEATKLPMGDSALGSSIEPHGEGMMSQSIIFNGHGEHKRQGMEDSSISLFSIEESVTSQASVLGTLPESERRDGTPATQTEEQLDQLITLIDTSGKINSLVTGRPLIAFEESNRRSDVQEYLS